MKKLKKENEKLLIENNKINNLLDKYLIKNNIINNSNNTNIINNTINITLTNFGKEDYTKLTNEERLAIREPAQANK
jgi:hypothetical protein